METTPYSNLVRNQEIQSKNNSSNWSSALLVLGGIAIVFAGLLIYAMNTSKKKEDQVDS